nr:MAG TPA: hypothetical protein [Caudoviricetes sp.]
MKSLYHFEKLFNAGVTHEEAPDVLSDYMERGAKVAIDWKQEGNEYQARLMVSTLEDEWELDTLGFVFGNEDLDDLTGFTDGKGGDRADESEPYTRCEDELLDRFGLLRGDLAEITHSWGD